MEKFKNSIIKRKLKCEKISWCRFKKKIIKQALFCLASFVDSMKNFVLKYTYVKSKNTLYIEIKKDKLKTFLICIFWTPFLLVKQKYEFEPHLQSTHSRPFGSRWRTNAGKQTTTANPIRISDDARSWRKSRTNWPDFESRGARPLRFCFDTVGQLKDIASKLRPYVVVEFATAGYVHWFGGFR